MASWLGWSGGGSSQPEPRESSRSLRKDIEAPETRALNHNHTGIQAEFQRFQAQVRLSMDDAIERLETRLSHLEQQVQRNHADVLQLPQRGANAPETFSPSHEVLPMVVTELETLSKANESVDARLYEFQSNIDRMKAELNSFMKDARSESDGVLSISKYESGLKLLEHDRDLAIIKANFFAVAVAESNQDERKKLLLQLKDQERNIREAKESQLNEAIMDATTELLEGDVFFIELDRTGGAKLGVSFDPAGQFLEVKSILAGGLMQRWNTQNFELLVKPGNLVVSVNDARGNAEKMEDELKQHKLLKIRILRRQRTNV